MSNRVENQSVKTIAISATFTAEPLEESLNFWRQELQNPFKIEFAPYNQVFQQLLNPSSLLSNNKNGLNVILVRLEDWLRNENKLLSKEKLEKVKENVNNLALALKSASERSSTPYLVCVCPASPTAVADGVQAASYKQMEDFMLSELDVMGNVHLVRASELTSAYPVSAYYDAHSDELANVPYTPTFFAALGTMIARKFHAIQSPPYKVIVLDCDQTLWKGICGEDGPLGIEIDPPRKMLQEFTVGQYNTGMLICLCSKNNEEDVNEVFEHHPEMPLKREHIVSWRINWRPKSDNIKSLASDLGLGLDSFILIDDNPVECAEVQATCPEVLALCLPKEPDSIPRFLAHIWVFDHLKITAEDKKRTILYQQNAKREHYRQQSLTFKDFLAGLELEVRISEAKPHHLTRAAQLTQRTNQFNFTTIRRSEADIQKLCQSGALECLIVEVSDRFGDYGLVGVILFKADSGVVKVDTFLLSCRAMGKGIEHRMLARLGEIGKERGLGYVEVAYVPTKKNQPALDFLDGICSGYKEPLDSGFLCRFPSGYVNTIAYNPRLEEPTGSSELDINNSLAIQTSESRATYTQAKTELFYHIATNLYSAEQILKTIESQPHKQRPNLLVEYVAPGNGLERSIANIWQKVLGIEKVGIHDNFFEIGGTSLKGIQLIAQLRREFNTSIPVASLFERPTISSMAKMFETNKDAEAVDEATLASRKRGEKRRAKLMSRRN
jgi:FkbH-like protein